MGLLYHVRVGLGRGSVASQYLTLWYNDGSFVHEDESMTKKKDTNLPQDFEFTFEPEDVVYEFIEAWTDGEYEFAYELLSSDSELREGLSQEEWVERRRAWAEQAQPKTSSSLPHPLATMQLRRGK